jgi:hypothetical protein
LVLPTRMDHNDFDFCEDLITPFYHFMKQFDINTREPKSAHSQMKIPEEYYTIPRAYQQLSIPMSWACCCNPSNIGTTRHATVSGLSDRADSRLGDPDELNVADLPVEHDRATGSIHGSIVDQVKAELNARSNKKEQYSSFNNKLKGNSNANSFSHRRSSQRHPG